MSHVIRIPDDLYERLKEYAEGFDTPANVIKKILDQYEGKSEDSIDNQKNSPSQSMKTPTSLEIIYHQGDKEKFKQALLKKKQAYLRLHKTNGTSEFKFWNASKFRRHSDVKSTLRSGHLRDWKKKGIYKAEVSTEESDIR